jgi:hypothetical protein
VSQVERMPYGFPPSRERRRVSTVGWANALSAQHPTAKQRSDYRFRKCRMLGFPAQPTTEDVAAFTEYRLHFTPAYSTTPSQSAIAAAISASTVGWANALSAQHPTAKQRSDYRFRKCRMLGFPAQPTTEDVATFTEYRLRFTPAYSTTPSQSAIAAAISASVHQYRARSPAMLLATCRCCRPTHAQRCRARRR